ncbi:PREDICTED: zinc finger BED domain-containing, partial [Prunus dulcis]
LGGLTSTGHTKEDSLKSCVGWVVIDKLPFSMVEDKRFRNFCDYLNPYFQLPSRRTLVRHFMT